MKKSDNPCHHVHAKPTQLYLCVDCGVDTNKKNEYYMVTDKVWKKAKLPDGRGMLCIGCLETRIGRQLESKDFMDVPINWIPLISRSWRLRDRLKTGAVV